MNTDGRELLYVGHCGCHIFVVIIFLRLSGRADVPLPIGCWFGYISNQMPRKCPTQTHLTGKVNKDSETMSC